MTENNPINVSAGGSVGIVGGGNVTVPGVINLGALSGSVTNALNQLPKEGTAGHPGIKNLLGQLQSAIEADTELPPADKADLLEQVQALAEATQTTEPQKKAGLVRKAQKIFEVTLKNLPDTARLAEACHKLLPMILRVLGAG